MVVLREDFLESDIDWITEACQDVDIQRWTSLPCPYTREHAVFFVEHPELEKQRWVIEHVGRAVGVIGVHTVNENGDAEIGYWMAPWGRGRRVMTAAVTRVAELLVADTAVRALTARIAVANTASRRVVESAGFVEAERIEQGCRDGDEPTDAIVYRRIL